MERLFIFKFTESKEQKTKIKALPILVVRLWRSFFYKIKISNMEKHFFKRILTVIITFVVVFLFGYIFAEGASSGDQKLNRAYMAFFFMLFMIVVVILGLVLDSIILYRKQEKGKAKASLLVLFILLLFIYLVFLNLH